MFLRMGIAASIKNASLAVLSSVTKSGLFVMDSSISYYGPVLVQCIILSSLRLIVAHICNTALVVLLTVHR